jgi:hypothetical protein
MSFGDPRLPQKFWARHEITVNGNLSPCWTYTSFRGLGPNGRTVVKFGREAPTTNYRFTCDLDKGPLPAGLTCSHICHNGLCANPDHIVYESLADNKKRGTNMQHPRAAEVFEAKMAANPSFRRSVKRYKKLQSNSTSKRSKDRYASDPEFRERTRAINRNYYLRRKAAKANKAR